jgi:ubiquinone/menaquinone biosynthesis C-methylase UbiE
MPKTAHRPHQSLARTFALHDVSQADMMSGHHDERPDKPRARLGIERWATPFGRRAAISGSSSPRPIVRGRDRGSRRQEVPEQELPDSYFIFFGTGERQNQGNPMADLDLRDGDIRRDTQRDPPVHSDGGDGCPDQIAPTCNGALAALAHLEPPVPIPDYLNRHYWWAYVHPNAVRVFERDWLVNLILWGNYRRLRDAALSAMGERLPGRSLQVACVYGDLTARMARRAAAGGGELDVVDVLPAQVANLRRKLWPGAPVRIMRQNSASLPFADASYDRVLLFFLLHEQPEDVRRRSMSEALRVVRPGGRIFIVDFSRPHWWHPLRYLWLPVLNVLEPFASALWSDNATTWRPPTVGVQYVSRHTLFGGLYQLVTIIR